MKPSSTNPSSRPAERARPVVGPRHHAGGDLDAGAAARRIERTAVAVSDVHGDVGAAERDVDVRRLLVDESAGLESAAGVHGSDASWRYPWLTGNSPAEDQHRRLFRNQRNGVLLGRPASRRVDDGYWNFGMGRCAVRSPAFNPLAYNPAIQYLPWNNNGVRLPNSSIGGTTNVAVGAKTEWDPRNLPPSMGGGSVFSKLTTPSDGVIDTNGELRSWPRRSRAR